MYIKKYWIIQKLRGMFSGKATIEEQLLFLGLIEQTTIKLFQAHVGWTLPSSHRKSISKISK